MLSTFHLPIQHRPSTPERIPSTATMARYERDRTQKRRKRTAKNSLTATWLACIPTIAIIVVSISFISALIPLFLRRHRVFLTTKSRPKPGRWTLLPTHSLRAHAPSPISQPRANEEPFHRHREERSARWRDRHHRMGRRNIVRDHVGRIVEAGPVREMASMAEEEKDTSERLHTYRGPHAHQPYPVDERTSQSFTMVSANSSQASEASGGDDDEEVVEEEEEDADGEGASGEKRPGGNATVTSGAEKSSRLVDFMGCLGGTTDGMIRGYNVTRVSHTLYKVMKLFGFSSLVDSPAGSHVEWIGELARRLTFDQPMFRYIGVDASEERLKKVKEAIGADVEADYEVHDVEKDFCNSTDVVFHWTELNNSSSDPRSQEYLGHIRKVMLAAKKADHGYIIIGQFPRLKGPMPTYKYGKWVFVDMPREDPFLFNDYIRGVVPMIGGSQAYGMYLTFYSLRSIPLTALAV